MSDKDPRPFIVLTAILDGSARPAAITVSHGEAFERVFQAVAGHDVLGPDIVELTVPPQAFKALRRHLGAGSELVAVYDVFPLAPALPREVRTVAGQFLAAEILWAMEEQGLLKGVPINLKLDLPKGWDKAPKAIHERLVGAGALELAPSAVETYKDIKAAWDRLGAEAAASS
ncbi:MAG: hypothetical protein ACFCGT_08830 [Sandaracinaceae bacterium]